MKNKTFPEPVSHITYPFNCHLITLLSIVQISTTFSPHITQWCIKYVMFYFYTYCLLLVQWRSSHSLRDFQFDSELRLLSVWISFEFFGFPKTGWRVKWHCFRINWACKMCVCVCVWMSFGQCFQFGLYNPNMSKAFTEDKSINKRIIKFYYGIHNLLPNLSVSVSLYIQYILMYKWIDLKIQYKYKTNTYKKIKCAFLLFIVKPSLLYFMW